MTAIINTLNKNIEYKIYHFSDMCTMNRIERYYKGLLNSYNDEPAMISNYGVKMWFKNGKLHRDNNKPETTYDNDSEFYFKNGELHKNYNKPTFIFSDGHKTYWINGIQIK